MKNILILSVILVLSISGCINLSGQKAGFEMGTSTVDADDLSLSIKAVPTEVKSGRSMSLTFTLQSKENDLKDVSVNAYDICSFTADKTEENITSMKQLTERKWSWKFILGETDFAKDCEIKLRASYKSNLLLTQDVISMSESEYYARGELGTLSELTVNSQTSTNPLKISLSFSDEQPFITGEEQKMYVHYSYSGDGYIDKLDDVNITVPDFIASIECNGYELVTQDNGDRYLTQTREIKFSNKEAASTTCTFSTDVGSEPIKTGKISLTATYIYKFDESLIVKIIP